MAAARISVRRFFLSGPWSKERLQKSIWTACGRIVVVTFIIHTVTKLAHFHIEFEGIHPFIDGTGRLLVNLELMKAGYPPIDIKFTDRLTYYNAFDEYHVKHNLSAMEKLFAGYINERLDMYLAML